MDECNTILSAYTMHRHLEWCCTHISMFSLPLARGQNLAILQLKEFADNKLYVTENIIFGLHRVGILWEKEKTLVIKRFQKALSSWRSKAVIVW